MPKGSLIVGDSYFGGLNTLEEIVKQQQHALLSCTNAGHRRCSLTIWSSSSTRMATAPACSARFRVPTMPATHAYHSWRTRSAARAGISSHSAQSTPIHLFQSTSRLSCLTRPPPTLTSTSFAKPARCDLKYDKCTLATWTLSTTLIQPSYNLSLDIARHIGQPTSLCGPLRCSWWSTPRSCTSRPREAPRNPFLYLTGVGCCGEHWRRATLQRPIRPLSQCEATIGGPASRATLARAVPL